jgi:hypothetical protein
MSGTNLVSIPEPRPEDAGSSRASMWWFDWATPGRT